MQYTAQYLSLLGGITLASDGERLTGLWFHGQKYFGSTLTALYEHRELPIFRQTAAWLDQYFAGQEPDFIPPLKLEGPPFRQAVWEVLLTIPYGETMTYGDIARRLGRMEAFQAVGGAVGHNPISIIVPCHRVVGSDGGLRGYAGGLDKKARLLRLEQEGDHWPTG